MGTRIRAGMSRARIAALVGVSVALVATMVQFSQGPAQAEAKVLTFNIHCDYSHSANDDPIVFPGQLGASHRHDFFGNSSTNAATTTASLVKAPSTCENGWDKLDHSSYWIPALTKAGNPIAGPDNYAVTAYYRRDGGSTGPRVQPFPLGLRMIAGDAKATSYNKAQDMWGCRNTDGSTYTDFTKLPNCPSGKNQYLTAKILFPSCWNGRDLDSADHKSHMAWPVGSNWECPASHPVKVPKLDLKVMYHGIRGDLTGVDLSSGHFGSMHADFFNAWDPAAQAVLVNQCLNTVNALSTCQNPSASDFAISPTSPDQLAKLAAGSTTTTVPPPTTTVKPTTTTVNPTTTTVPATTQPGRTLLAADFDDWAPGSVPATFWNSRMGGGGSTSNLEDTSVVARTGGTGRALRTYLQANTVGPIPSGTNGVVAVVPFSQPVDEATIQYDVNFQTGFDWGWGGKLPGLAGVRPGVSPIFPTSGRYAGDDGWSGRLMWLTPGSYRAADSPNEAVDYMYGRDQQSQFGDNLWWNRGFTAGKWHTVKTHYKLNSVVNGVGQRDGVLETWIDGVKVVDKQTWLYRSRTDVRIHMLYWDIHRGGGSLDWAGKVDSNVDIDNLRIYQP